MMPSLALFAYIIDARRKSSRHVQAMNEDTSNRRALFEITASQHFVGKTVSSAKMPDEPALRRTESNFVIKSKFF